MTGQNQSKNSERVIDQQTVENFVLMKREPEKKDVDPGFEPKAVINYRVRENSKSYTERAYLNVIELEAEAQRLRELPEQTDEVKKLTKLYDGAHKDLYEASLTGIPGEIYKNGFDYEAKNKPPVSSSAMPLQLEHGEGGRKVVGFSLKGKEKEAVAVMSVPDALTGKNKVEFWTKDQLLNAVNRAQDNLDMPPILRPGQNGEALRKHFQEDLKFFGTAYEALAGAENNNQIHGPIVEKPEDYKLPEQQGVVPNVQPMPKPVNKPF